MLVLLVANLIILPVTISFFNDDFSPRWVVFYVGSDTVLLLDVLINFRTGLSLSLSTVVQTFSIIIVRFSAFLCICYKGINHVTACVVCIAFSL